MSELNGRELDAAVAVRWFGWRWYTKLVGVGEGVAVPLSVDAAELFRSYSRGMVDVTDALDEYQLMPEWGTAQLPHYSTDMNAAMEVVAAVLSMPVWTLYTQSRTSDNSEYWASFRRHNSDGSVLHYDETHANPATAICLAAMKVPQPPC